MGQLGSKLRRTGADDGYFGTGYGHWCPACEEMHVFAVEKPFRNGAQWTFDGNIENPTFTPSMNISVGPFPDGRIERCHYFLKNGQLQYLGDCTHALKNQTVPLPPLPAHMTDEGRKR